MLFMVFVLEAGCRSSATPGSAGSIRDIFAGVADVFILREDGTLWAAGYNRSGQLGSGEAPSSPDVRIVRINDGQGNPLGGVKTIAAGENHTVILKEDGTLWGAGSSPYGELGQGADSRLAVFTQLQAGSAPLGGVKAAAAGNNSTFFIGGDGSLWAAGYNYYGELGLGNRENQTSFIRADSAGQNIRAVAAGVRHTAALKEDGSLWMAGYNFNGQLGLGNTEDHNSFTPVNDPASGVSAVAAGNYHTVILKNDGSVWAAGSNYWGQLGFPGGGDRPRFTQVPDENGNPLTGVREIAARGNITVVLKNDGSLLFAGTYTNPGELDDPSSTLPSGTAAAPENSAQNPASPAPKSTFVPLVPESGGQGQFGGAKKIVLGYNSIYVIAGDGFLWAAGSNRYGQLNLSLDTDSAPALKLINP
jgi:alpha-tubulin suppressor-like RCC1 family protein